MVAHRKKRTTVITPKPYPVRTGTGSLVHESADDTVGQEFVRRVRAAGEYTKGDQTAPAANPT